MKVHPEQLAKSPDAPTSLPPLLGETATEPNAGVGTRCSVPGSELKRRLSRMGPGFEDLDLDRDGDIDEEDLQRLVSLKRSQEKLIKSQRYGIAVLSIVIIGVGVGLGLELEASKRSTEAAIQDARLGEMQEHIEIPAELRVATAQTARSAWSPQNASPQNASLTPGTGAAPSPVPVDFVNKENQPVRTDRSFDKLKLTSELPDEVFSALEQLKIEGPDGSINFKTQGFARYKTPPGEHSRCGDVVVVYTSMGSVQFDGTAMMFNEGVAGAFERAGFRVSAPRKRRIATATNQPGGRSRRSTERDENNLTLIGVNRIFGEFRFIKKIDMSMLSCGDETPTLQTPFDGDVYDIQVEEESLTLCHPDVLPGEAQACPYTVDMVKGWNGEVYFKRKTQMRAKKIDGVWHTIRSTTFPDLDADSELHPKFRGGTMVELSAGTHGQTYEYWPNDAPPVVGGKTMATATLTRCRNDVDTEDFTDGIEANSTDYSLSASGMTIAFVGYEVFNNHYIKRFKVLHNGSKMVDYLELFEENRMYTVQVTPGYMTTYESIKTNGDVDPGFLQGEGYPDIDDAEFGYGGAVQCNDDLLWGSIVPSYETVTCLSAVANASNASSGCSADSRNTLPREAMHGIQLERIESALRPDLQRYANEAWDFPLYEANAGKQLNESIESLGSIFKPGKGSTAGAAPPGSNVGGSRPSQEPPEGLLTGTRVWVATSAFSGPDDRYLNVTLGGVLVGVVPVPGAADWSMATFKASGKRGQIPSRFITEMAGRAPLPPCSDSIQNGDETGVDCGGYYCDACPTFPTPTCSDSIQNGDETGTDCGGSACSACPTDGVWSDFDPCSKTCGGGTQRRICRPPGGGQPCTGSGWQCPIYRCGDGSTSQQCNTQDCPPIGAPPVQNFGAREHPPSYCPALNLFARANPQSCCDQTAPILLSRTCSMLSWLCGSYLDTYNVRGRCPVTCGACPTLTCSDGIQNADETGVDCGGYVCDPCPTPTCSDSIKNGDETGTDCGGAACSACPTAAAVLSGDLQYFSIARQSGSSGLFEKLTDGYACTSHAACPGYCKRPQAYVGPLRILPDSLKDVEFGTCQPCTDLESSHSKALGGAYPSKCVTSTCSDGIQNGFETGVDCGGNFCDACPMCQDGVQNQDETAVDCGGAICDACPTNRTRRHQYSYDHRHEHYFIRISGLQQQPGDGSTKYINLMEVAAYDTDGKIIAGKRRSRRNTGGVWGSTANWGPKWNPPPPRAPKRPPYLRCACGNG